MDVPRLFKAATPDLVARKVFRIKTVKRGTGAAAAATNAESTKPTTTTEKSNVKNENEPIELTVTSSEQPNAVTSSGGAHVNETSIDTSSTDTGISRMESGQKVPVLAVGTYHRKEAAPILAAAARLDLPSTSTMSKSAGKEKNSNKEPAPPLPHPAECGQPCVSGQTQMFQSRSTNAQQGPPPNRPMPRPPGGIIMPTPSKEHDYTNDYEDPEEMAARSRGDGFTNHLLIKTTPPPVNFNSYEMSMSQQRRSQQHQPMAPPLSDCWGSQSHGNDGGVLHKNADGAYYIPSGSLRTTSSTLSPASGQRYLDQPGAPNTTYSDASTTLLKYPLNVGTHQNRRRQVGTMNHGEAGGAPTSSSSKKKKKFDDDGARWLSKWNLLLVLALLVSLLVICVLLFRAPTYVYTQPAPSSDSTSYSAAAAHRYQDLGLRALPPAISLGERVDVEFFPKSMATTELTVTKPARITFNATVGSGAQLVLLMSAGVHPSLSLHDALFPIRADRIRDPHGPTHLVEEIGTRSRRSAGKLRNMEILSPRSATFEQFLLEGRHYLTFINERSRIEPISFIAEEIPRPTIPTKTSSSSGAASSTKDHPLVAVLVCEANCNQRGECIHGKCQCAPGFTGRACEEAVCPVVCSGNGVFSGGICVCKSGFKGKECEMRHNWCEVADCNGRGRCDTDGRCRCNSGWTGEACELKACPHATCHDRGVCVNGTCYCADGWRGADCSVFADALPPSVVQVPVPLPLPPKRNPEAKKSKTPTDKKKESREIPTTPIVHSSLSAINCHHGQLIDEICHCPPEFTSPDCSKPACNCTNGDCQDDGTCQCWAGWRGLDCAQKKCSHGCEENGKCLPDGTCQCAAGWNGENCYQEGCPNQCSSKGECVMDRRSSEWSCRCQAGSIGADCSIPIEMHCDDGLDNDSDGLIDCDDPECCSSPSCSSESVCSTAASPTEVLMRMPPTFNANFAQRVGFLIMEKSVQSYTDASQFNEYLTSVIRGRVVWRGSTSSSEDASKTTVPLIGVRVSDAAHPLYGFTLTRADGYFDLVVNGARSVNLQFLRTQFQSIKKSVYVPARQVIHIDDIIMYRQSGGMLPSITSPPARAKCSPTLRRLPEVVLISNWQYTSDGVEPITDSSRLVVDSRSIVETLPIQGTDVRLVYDSARSPAAPSTMLVGLLDERPDRELRKIHVTIRIAGRRFDKILAPRANLTYVFAWDKMNAYRQSESGLVPVTVQVGYEYLGCDRLSERVWQTRRTQMLGATARKMLGAMWTLDVHHHLDVVNSIVEMGDGGYRLISEAEPQATTIAGIDATKRDVECSAAQCDGSLDQIPLFRPTTVVYAQDGSLIIGDHNLIRRIAPNGSINTILTLSLADTSHSYYIAVSPFDGTIAISLPLHKQVWKITSLEPQDSRNNYDVLAGDGTVCASAVDSCGDGALAQNAQLIFPKGIAFDRYGNLYLADSRRIRVIDTSGHIRSIGETAPEQHPHPIRNCAQMTKLVDLQMEWPTSLAIDPVTGTVLVLDTNVVYEIDVENEVVTIPLGAPATCDIAIATPTSNSSLDHQRHLIQNARDITVGADGAIYVVESDGRRLNQVRRLCPDRSSFSILIGGKSPCSCDVAACGCDDSTSIRGVSASQAHLNSPHAVCVAPSGDVIIADSGNAKIKKVASRFAKFNEKSRKYEVPDAERQEKYIFNRHGQHTSTVSLVTGRTLFNFTYQVDSPIAPLSEIRAASGLVLRTNKRNESVTDLETTHGEVTTLTMSAYDGTLEQVARKDLAPTKDVTRLVYTSKGLLASRIDVATAVGFEYDENGRAIGLKRDREHWRLGEEIISMGRVNTNVYLNGQLHQHVRLGEGDLAIQDSNGATTRLITLLRNEGYSLTSPLGTSSLFDKSSSLPGSGVEAIISRRRTTVPAISNPQRRALTTRWDWRHVARRVDGADGSGSGSGKRRVAEVRFRPRINGISMFSIDYDVSANTDTLRLSSTAAEDSPALLQIHYNPAGRIRRITPSDDIAPLNITYDSSGRKSKIAWGSWKHQFTYDSSSRVTEHAIDGAQVPVKMSYSGAARRPSEIQQDGAKFGIHYDNYDRLKEVVSPSQETSTFSSIALGGDEWVLKRRTPLNSRPSVVRIDRNGKILEATTPDEMHHYLERKDASGKITEILNDEETTVVTHWSPEGVPMATRSRDLVMNSTLQGHLLARRTVTMMGMSSSFTYEYDDLLRLTTILPVVEQSALEPIQISYDEKRGHVASINGFLWARDVSTARCQGHGMMYETSKADEHRQIVQRKVIFGDARASLKITRDRAGRAAETVLEVTSSSSGSPITQTTKRTFDATGRLASVNQQSETTRIQWNGDGRVEKINDRIVEYSRGGALKTYLDTKYHVDSIGWVHRRGNDTNTKFQYDGKGRLISATQKNLVVKIVYDVEDRVVKIQKNDDVTHLYYAYVDHPKLVSHFSKNGKISTIFYDDDQVPFAVQTDEGTRLAVLADETGSIRAIVGKDSDVVVLPERSIFGAPAPLETLTEPLLPLGYLGGIEIPEISVSILENGRPLDLLTGRYLSISPAAVIRMQFTGAFANSIDLMALEYERQPYRVGSVPEDFATWFSLAGLSPTILPSVHLGLPPASPIAHRLLSSFPRKLRPLSHLTTVFATQLSSDSLAPPPASTCWSIDDIGFSNLLILTENRQNGSVIVQPLADLKQDELAVITKLFDGVKSLDFATWGLVPTRHLWSVPNAKLEFSSTSFSHFTLAVNKDNVELRNGKSKIVVHFAENKSDIIKKISDDLKSRERVAVWRAERKRVDNGEETWHKWTDRELRELTSKGSVSNYDIEMRPAHQSGLLASVHSWKFRKIVA